MTTIASLLGRNAVHPFPARMAPSIVVDALASKRPLTVLDPMMGSGTVLALARSLGHRVLGFDTDPLAVLISTVWTSAIDIREFEYTAKGVLNDAKRIFADLPVRDAYPATADEETKRFVRFWFDPYARRQLAALAQTIEAVSDHRIQSALWCGFSRLIITKQFGASRAMDLSHSRPHRVFPTAPAKPFSHFDRAIRTVSSGCLQKGQLGIGPRVYAQLGDARSIPLRDDSIDLVLTSPPYLNGIDYMRTSKFSLVWMGHLIADLRIVRSTSIGAESRLDGTCQDTYLSSLTARFSPDGLQAKHTRVVTRFIDDMRRTISEVSRVLRISGRTVFIVGDSSVSGGKLINTSGIVEDLAAAVGLNVIDKRVRTLPANRRYLPSPTKRKSGRFFRTRLRRETVLTLAFTGKG